MNKVVFKFGGASVKDAASIRRVCRILKRHEMEKPLVVISAIGKTTNALENLASAYFNREAKYTKIFARIKEFHLDIINDLSEGKKNDIFLECKKIFAGMEQLLKNSPSGNFDFHYDQIVSFGEILSTVIISHWLNRNDCLNRWVDVRNYLKTDENYREAGIIWHETENLVIRNLSPLLSKQMIITQGFIGRSLNNYTTTLGREGSDYTAAIFSNILDAASMVIWKDVPGVLNADPRYFKEAVKIDHLSYNEAIEMTYYGAKVIHPKTIKPLQNKSIPLHVRSFLHAEKEGTLIDKHPMNGKRLPVIVLKKEQTLLKLTTKDFSFLGEGNLSFIYQAFANTHLSINMMQNTAISFLACMDNNKVKTGMLCERLQDRFDIEISEGLLLLTIRNFDDKQLAKIEKLTKPVLMQRTSHTIQVLLQDEDRAMDLIATPAS